MRKLVTVLSASVILLTGCSSPEPELTYDPLELIEYQNCLNNPPSYFGGVFTPPRNWAEQACEDKRPILK
jgi:hypothetical protein